jgi:hypothetical protein
MGAAIALAAGGWIRRGLPGFGELRTALVSAMLRLKEGSETTRCHESQLQNITSKVTLRRDKQGPFKFTGERIGAATRTFVRNNNNATNNVDEVCEVSVRLYRTAGGKYVLGVEVYNRTLERFEERDAWLDSSLEALVDQLKPGTFGAHLWLDTDILAEVFEDTEIADRFVKQIE